MCKKLCLLLILTNLSIIIFAIEKESRVFFIGFNPAITVEPFYKDNEFDVNIFPLVYESLVNTKVDIRVISIVNYGIRNSRNSVTHLGFQLAAPIYFFRQNMVVNETKGLFVSPGVGCTRNIEEKHTNIGLWIEPGYCFDISKNFRLNISLQEGVTYFIYDNKDNIFGNHFGIKIILGKWLK